MYLLHGPSLRMATRVAEACTTFVMLCKVLLNGYMRMLVLSSCHIQYNLHGCYERFAAQLIITCL